MPHLINTWSKPSQLINEASQVLLAFDYDGTLSPIEDHPDMALLPTETKEWLIILNRKEKYLVGVISTRALEDVRDKVGINDLVYAGNRGLEISGGGMDFVHPEALRLKESVEQTFLLLKQNLERFDGVIVEHKGLSLTVHYRMAPGKSVREVKEATDAVTSPFVKSGALKLSTGKMAIEILPDILWGKGDAIRKIQETLAQCSLPVYFGDDLVDEEGFAAVQAASGFGVFVGPASTNTIASYRVDSPNEVTSILRLMAQM